MLCSSCKDKPIHRGIKTIKCSKCNNKSMINSAHGNGYNSVCNVCSDRFGICVSCLTHTMFSDVGVDNSVYAIGYVDNNINPNTGGLVGSMVSTPKEQTKKITIEYTPKGDEVIYSDEERRQLIKSLSKILKKLNYSFEIK